MRKRTIAITPKKTALLFLKSKELPKSMKVGGNYDCDGCEQREKEKEGKEGKNEEEKGERDGAITVSRGEEVKKKKKKGKEKEKGKWI